MTTRQKAKAQARMDAEESASEPTAETAIEETSESPTQASEQPTETTTTTADRRTLVYRGNADVFEFGALRIRPGEPFDVAATEAEDLLTYPRERFEDVSQE